MNILFVCTGNTCRSPMAEGYLKDLNLKDVFVKSRGLSVYPSKASDNSVTAMKNVGIDISGHISMQITNADILWADKIFCMSSSHKQILEQVAENKTFVLGDGISDPYGFDLSVYENCRDEIFRAIDKEMADLFIVPMEEKHIDSVVLLEKECFSSPWSKQTLSDAMKVNTKFFVAQKKGTVMGYIGISCVLDEGYVTNVAVFPDYRKRGVATALVNRVLKLKDEIGLSFVSLEVRKSNQNAISLYEKSGFKEEGIRKNFYSSPLEDAIIMTKRF